MDRRNFLSAAGLGGIGIGAFGIGPEHTDTVPSGLTITGIETIPIRGRAMILKMHTNQGITGFGEPLNYEHWRVVAQAVDDIAEYLKDKDPLRMEHHWQVMYRSSYAQEMPILLSAMSGLDMAMWDVLGKVTGQPVWRLLGGQVRDRVRVYTGIGGNTPDELAQNARRAVADGFHAVKMSVPGPVHFVDMPSVIDENVARVAAVREAVGNDVMIGVDFHRRLSVPMGKMLLKELEPFRPMFAEEVLKPGNDEALYHLSRSTTIPIATGERQLTRWSYREMIEREMVAILQPDIRHCGGISEMRKIANHAEIHNMAMAPHNAGSGAIGVAASVHVMATVPNFLICEGGRNRGEGLFRTPLVFNDGFIELPTAPGLGVDMDDAAIEALRDESFRLRGMYFHEDDGSYGDY
jgi:galactonate dehydratase